MDNIGSRAHFLEAIASAMEAEAIPSYAKNIQSELDALKTYQTEDGMFKEFGKFPELNGCSKSTLYFQTAFVLIPFLKFKKQFNISYDEVINKSFSYLNAAVNETRSNEEGLSVAALAYALHDNHDKARSILTKVSKTIIEINIDQKCCKTSLKQTKCDLRHTSYTAIAYLMLNETENAKPLVNWLTLSLQNNKRFEATHSHAIATEAVAKYLSIVPAKQTNLTISVRNDLGFEKNVTITNEIGSNNEKIPLPSNTSAINIKTSGIGFLSVTTMIQRTILTSQSSSKLNLTVTPLVSTAKNFKIVEVCATYHPTDINSMSQTLANVIYDIEMPTGFIYSNVMDSKEQVEIKVRNCT